MNQIREFRLTGHPKPVDSGSTRINTALVLINEWLFNCTSAYAGEIRPDEMKFTPIPDISDFSHADSRKGADKINAVIYTPGRLLTMVSRYREAN